MARKHLNGSNKLTVTRIHKFRIGAKHLLQAISLLTGSGLSFFVKKTREQQGLLLVIPVNPFCTHTQQQIAALKAALPTAVP